MRPQNWLSTIPLRLRSLFLRKRVDRELDEELRDHVEQKTALYIANGMTPKEARRRALIELGGIEQAKENCRDQRRVAWLQDFLGDLRYGARMLRKSPNFTIIAVLTLALGIGANTAIFSAVDAAVLHPLPYPHSSRLVLVYAANRKAGVAESTLTYPDFTEVRDTSQVFSAVAGMASHDLTLTGRGEPSIVSTVSVTPQYFSVLGVKPMLGRAFLAADGLRGAAPVAILSENLWRTRFAGDPKIIGSSIVLDHRPFTVIGVMPADFRSPFFPAKEQVWIPLLQDPLFGTFAQIPGRRLLATLARLRAGVSRKQAQAQMEAIAARLVEKFPAQNRGWTMGVNSLEAEVVGKQVKTALFILLGAVGLVLLVACADIASLLLARATARTREMAVRAALGAPRGRLVRQLLAESMLLGAVGAIAGIALAFAGVQGLHSFLPSAITSLQPIRLNGEVLVFALGLSLAASFLFGLAPAVSAADANLHPGLREAARTTESSSRRRLRGTLAAAELAVAMVLVVGAGLLIHSFVSLTTVNPGFDTRDVWQAEVSLPRFEYSTPKQWVAFSNEFLRRLQAEPGMREAAFGVPLPFFVQGGSVELGVSIVGNPPPARGTGPTADYFSTSPDYFRVMGVPLLRGRFFSEEDSFTAPRVAIVSRAFAQLYFPHDNPIGKQLAFGFPPNTQVVRRIVGVVGDVRDVSLGKAPAPAMYVPFAQEPFWGGTLVVKSSLDSASVYAAIRQATASIDPNLPVTEFEPLQEAVAASAASPRFRALLFGLFGALALALAAAGVFGVLSYSVSQRTNAFGVRIALGASPGSIRKMALAEGAKLAGAGLGVGTLAAFGLARLLQSQLYAVTPRDPLTYAGAAILLAGVALVACYLPARRAMRVDPAQALRHE